MAIRTALMLLATCASALRPTPARTSRTFKLRMSTQTDERPTKPLADAHLNAKYVRNALLAQKSSGCRRAPSHAYDKFDNALLAGRAKIGGGDNWNYSRAEAACEALVMRELNRKLASRAFLL